MADPFTAQGNEESITEAMARYAKKGFSASFTPLGKGMVRCDACHDSSPAEQVPMKAMHRFEGVSDPSDECALAGLECPSCGEWGTIMLSYGPEGSSEDHDVLSRLLDDRDHSGIQPGL